MELVYQVSFLVNYANFKFYLNLELCDIREVVVSLAVVYPAMFSPTKPGTKRDFEFMI